MCKSTAGAVQPPELKSGLPAFEGDAVELQFTRIQGGRETVKRGPLLITLLLASTVAAQDVPKTLAAFKQHFLNQQVVIGDVPFEQNYLLQWMKATQNPDGTYTEADDIDNHLSVAYKGQVGTVIAIHPAPSFSSGNAAPGGTNALGEKVTEGEITDPYLDVVVRFSDGTLAIIRGYPITLIPGNLELASSRSSLSQEVEAKLQSMVGRNLYAVGYSKLYKPTATLDEISGTDSILAQLSVSEVPLLQPLKVIKAKYLADVNAVVIEVTLPSGAQALAYTALQYSTPDEDLMSRICGTLLPSMPSRLTPKEISAIKSRSIFRGMSSDALDYTLGFKDSENDWGRGGTQRIYYGGKLVVYLDNSNHVVDWQSFD